jgi:hypothetical protein
MCAYKQTSLETAILDRLHELHMGIDFPAAKTIRVLRRENTGGGRYLDLESDALVRAENGYLDLGGSFIEMTGLRNGMMAVALVKDRRLTTLELTVYGGDRWDGEEHEWKIV